MEQNHTKNQAKFKVKTTQEDYSLEYNEYKKMLDIWKGNKEGREYVINNVNEYSFEIIATE